MKVRSAILLAVIAEALVATYGIIQFGLSVEGLQATTRFSGRLSLVLFSFIFLLHPRKKETLQQLLSTNYFLVFAVAHGIHLMELLSYVMLSGIPLVPIRLAGGFIAYLMIFLMPWFQMRFEQKKITEIRMQQLGFVYLFYVWFIFFMTYLSRVNGSFPNAGGSHTEHVVLMGWVCVMLGIKLGETLFTKGTTSN